MATQAPAAPRPRTELAELLESAQAVLNQQFGTAFCYVDAESLEPVDGNLGGPVGSGQLDWPSQAWVSAQHGRVAVIPISQLIQALLIPLISRERTELVAIGIFAVRPLSEAELVDERSSWLGDSPVQKGVGSRCRNGPEGASHNDSRPLFEPCHKLPYCEPELLVRMGQGAMHSIAQRRQLRIREAELGQMASQLTRNYEEITLLHQLTREAQVSHGVRALQEQTLALLVEILPTHQIAFIDAKDETVLCAGDSVLLPRRCRDLIQELGPRAARAVLVDNHLSTRGLATDFGSVEMMVSVPVAEGKDQFGWLLAIRTAGSPELGSVEASLMTAIAAILATHQTNVRLFANVKELFLGVVRALSSAIDAKDPYTCGHSERVAKVSRMIARKLGLSEDEQNRVYLSGLLHDVGKIGIRDSVLGKPGRLTDDEMEHIKQHPRIGFDILSAVRQLKPVLAGVRSHHESMNGTGYPDRLKGEEIPLMARIVAVADSFDAMSSDRPYRQGMPAARVEAIFREGAGKQWDKQVVETLLGLHDQILEKHGMVQKGVGSRCRNGPEGASHNDSRPLFEPGESAPGEKAILSDSSDQVLDLGRISKFISLSVG